MRGAVFALGLLLAGTIPPAAAGAQGCGPIRGITTRGYGKGCPGAGATPPVLQAALVQGSGCALRVTVGNVTWVPNVYFNGWILLLGTTRAALPVLRPGCRLLVPPQVALARGRQAKTVRFPLPPDPALVGRTIHLQAAAHYVGFYFGPDLSAGLSVTFT